ncbi:thiamine phosphate synthase [Longirhabdus pacifica]|uniref:thiamine phosphate synthase n=1 Tax=Longirhabdus pacifica TaxID=2305227 RepID=UPI001008F53F|nr:thiamine phosphate synthase [Longirhabdus pacifica]
MNSIQHKMSLRQMKHHLSLYFVMGSENCLLSPLQTLQQAIAGGVTMFQFREKSQAVHSNEAEKYKLASLLQSCCKNANIPFIVNDDVEMAIRLHADGVHIGQEDEQIQTVREKMKGKIVGVSAHNVREAQDAMLNGADYIGVGPMYPTTTKLDISTVYGPSMIAKMRAEGITLPIVGIGGVNIDRVPNVMEAGADGVAVISAISKASSPLQSAKQLKQQVMHFMT